MAESTGVNHVWVGIGGGPPKLCVGGRDAAEFKANLAELFGTEMLDTLVAYFDGEASAAVNRAAAQAVMDAGIAAPGGGANQGPTTAGAQTPAPASGAAASGDAPVAQGVSSGPTEETDQYKNLWTYNVPGAPSCPHGPRVRKAGTSRAGKAYTGWFCVTGSPYARRNNIAEDKGCKAEFSN